AGLGTQAATNPAIDVATLKFREDVPPTIKFREDVPPTIKFREDVPPTIKFREDGPPTIKFREDGPTVKFRDDGTTFNKFVDDPSPTLKFRDDVKSPLLDKPPPSDLATGPGNDQVFGPDPGDPVINPGGGFGGRGG